MNRRSVAAILALAAAVWLGRGVGAVPAGQAKPDAPLTDLDAFMSRVLERRNENWKTLHDYILSERETFQILGPGGIPIAGQRREFEWFIRDGYLVRSPVKANGASLGEADRRKYEADWLKKEQDREQRAKEKAARKDKAALDERRESRPRRRSRGRVEELRVDRNRVGQRGRRDRGHRAPLHFRSVFHEVPVRARQLLSGRARDD